MLTTSRLLALTAALTAATGAHAITITDAYWGAQPGIDHTSGGPAPYGSFANTDVIGTSLFDVKSMDVNVVGGNLIVTVNTNYDPGASGADGTTYGDLLLSTSGWSPCGTAGTHYACDDLSTGTTWNFGVSTAGQELYSLGGGNSADVLTTDAAFGNGHRDGFIYRIGQGTQVNTSGAGVGAVDGAAVSIVPGTSITYTIALADLGSFTDLGLSWNMTCGNDTIQGDYSVPEPGTIGLLSLGLLGIGFASRRRRAIA
jgi:PEP-CTERM motif